MFICVTTMIIFLHPYQIANSYSSTFRRLRRLCIKQQKKSFQNQPSTKNRVKFFFVALAVTKWVKFRSNALLAVFLFPFLHFLSVLLLLFSIEGGTQEDQEEEEEEKKAALSPFGRAQSQWTQTYSIWMGHNFFLQNALGVHITLHLINQMSIYMSYAVASRLILTYQDSPPSS